MQSLWYHPEQIPNVGCQVAIEPNFSIRPRMPIVVALYEIFRKRWLARYWQSQGVKIIVDVNVAPNYAGINLLGVPRGWKFYATRAHKGMHHWLEKEYQLCCAHAEDEITFLVYGGQTRGEVHRMCQQKGWLWIEDRMSVVRKLRQQEHREVVHPKTTLPLLQEVA